MVVFFIKLFIILILNILTSYVFSQNTIILKVKPLYKTKCSVNEIYIHSLQNILKNKQVHLKQLFPNAYFPSDTQDVFYRYCVDISTIYELQLISNDDITNIVKEISSLPEIEYCHIKETHELLSTTNDPAIGTQYYLNNVKAFQAWDIFKGDTSVVVGIVDTGTELAHDDLWGNIAYNYNDPLDGVDNDADGFVDNYRGWDVGNNDNSADWIENAIGANPHGVFVAGMAAPTTNNGIGIAGVGYKTKHLPIKIIDSTGVLSRSYEGIVYAADHGCRIINCSWGSTVPSAFGYDVVRYVTYNRKSLIFAAAGNNGHTSNDVNYPAAFDEVVAVAATNQIDVKWTKSCYGYHVDVSAPGENVYSTYSNNGYTFGWGTSYASPLAASVAALVYGYYQKQLNPFQLRAIIEQTSDKIDTLQGNQIYAEKIGKGRVNAFKALTHPIQKALRVFNYEILENNDTSILTFSIINLFKPTTNLYIKIRSSNTCVSFNEDSIFIGVLDSLQLLGNGIINFIFYVNSNCPLNQEVDFFIDVNDSSYTETFYFKAIINKSYADISNQVLTITTCSNGRIGYNSLNPIQGNGIKYYQNNSIVSEMGLLLYDTDKASWCVFGKNDFKTLNKVTINETENIIRSYAKYNDSLNNTPLNVEIHQNITLFKNDSLKHFAHINYLIVNKSNTNFDSLYIGLYSDVDILNPKRNIVNFDSLNKLLYTFTPYISGIHVGFWLSDYYSKNYYAFDNDGNFQSINIEDGLTLLEIKQIFKQNRFTAGGNNGNNVSSLVSYGPINLPKNDSLNLNFFTIFGRNYHELIANTQTLISLLDTTINISANFIYDDFYLFPNPSNAYFFINLPNIQFKKSEIIVKVIDVQGRIIYKENFTTKDKILVCHNFEKGIYIVQIQYDEYNVISKKMIIY